MRFTYDPEVDILMIHLRAYRPGEKSARSPEVLPGLIVDLDAKGNPIEIELLDASAIVPREELDSYGIDTTWIGLTEAAGRAGLSPSTLKNQAQAGRLKAIKDGRDWKTTEAWLREYLGGRKYNAKPAIAHDSGSTATMRETGKKGVRPR